MKRLQSKDRRDFDREVEAFKLLNNRSHPHIVRLLATFNYCEANYLLFPWADGDLAMFQRRNPEPEMSPENARWLMEQCRGIADALSIIHCVEKFEDGKATSLHGRHGDIKPANILVYSKDIMGQNGGSLSCGTFKLCDFGLARFRAINEGPEIRNGDEVMHTPTYRPPEVDFAQGVISPTSDMWSLGCVFTELATWALLGGAAVRKFWSRRAVDMADGTVCDAYFQLHTRVPGEVTASLKPSVEEVSCSLSSALDGSKLMSLVDFHASTQPAFSSIRGRLSRHGPPTNACCGDHWSASQEVVLPGDYCSA